MIRLPVAKIPFGMVEDMSLETESCQSWICQRNSDFWENKIDFIAMVIFEICDTVCYLCILAYFAAHDDTDNVIRRIFSGYLRYYLDFFFLWTTGTSMRHYRGEKYGHSVQILAWNVKFWAQRVKVLCPTLHSISVCAHCSTKSKC